MNTTLEILDNNKTIPIKNLPQYELRNRLTSLQKKFVDELKIPFLYNDDKKESVRVNRITDITRTLNIDFTTPYQWYHKNLIFKSLFQSILKLREEIYNQYAKDTLFDNIIDKKEISLIFYLKNKLSDEFKDDNILNQIFLKQGSLNLNFIQTQVNNLNSVQLVEKAKELSEKLSRLTHSSTEK